MSILDPETQKHLEKLGIALSLKEETVEKESIDSSFKTFLDSNDSIYNSNGEKSNEERQLRKKGALFAVCLLLLLSFITIWSRFSIEIEKKIPIARLIYDPDRSLNFSMTPKKEQLYWNEVESNGFFFQKTSPFMQLLQDRSQELQSQCKRIQDSSSYLEQNISISNLARLEDEMSKMREIDFAYAERLSNCPIDSSYFIDDPLIQSRLSEYREKQKELVRLEDQIGEFVTFFESGHASIDAISSGLKQAFSFLEEYKESNWGNKHSFREIKRLKTSISLAALIGIENQIEFDFCDTYFIDPTYFQSFQSLIHLLSDYKEHSIIAAMDQIQRSSIASLPYYGAKRATSLLIVDSNNLLQENKGDFSPSFLLQSIIYPVEKVI